MTAKDFLREIATLQQRRNVAKRIFDGCGMDTGVHGVDYSYTRVQTSARNRVEDSAWKMIDARNEAAADIESLTEEINRRLRMISGLSKPEYIEILILRYVDGKSFKEIADEMQKSPKTVANVHTMAIKAFARKYQTENDYKYQKQATKGGE